jgi:APA family basic amino acid/polyamine antiporter
MARDGLFLSAAGKIHPRYGTPHVAIGIMVAWALVLLFGTRGDLGALLSGVVFADWIFFGLTVATVLIFRKRVPLQARPPGTFQAPGYPIVPIAFSTIAAGVVFSVIYAEPYGAARGAALLAAGIPVYFWYTRTR